MDFLKIIELKKKNISLNKNECYFIINSFINENVPNYQLSALLMAIYFNGLNNNELIWFTEAIIETSEKINALPTNKLKIIIDKHSSGGIGDKVTLIISPILSAIGYDIVKLSGRGLGFTGGTIDKLESIGICYEYNKNTFQQLLDKTKFVLMLQSKDIVPGDKKMYSLRNATNTVDSFELIAISIMSKKLVINSDYIFLDIKIGDGAFCKTYEDGKKLSNLIYKIADYFKRKVYINLTDMNQPIGRAIGNAIEIKETLDFLRNDSQSQYLKKIIYEFCSDILIKTNYAKDESDAIMKIYEVIKNGAAYEQFINFVNVFSNEKQVILNNTYFLPKHELKIFSIKSGKISFQDVHKLGLIANKLGVNTCIEESKINYNAGIWLEFDPYTFVNKNQHIATLYSDSEIDSSLESEFNELLNYD